MKKLLLAMMIFLCGIGIAHAEMAVETEIDLSLGKDYDAQGQEVDLDSQTYTVNAICSIDDLTITGKIGLWNASTEVLGIDIDSSPGLVLGLDVEQKIIDLNEDMTLSAIGSYSYKDTEINEIAGFDMPLRNDVNLHEWEVGAKLTADILPTPIDLVPYAALVISDSQINIDSVFGGDIELEADKNIGLRLGLASEIDENWTVNAECSLIDDKSISIAGRCKF